MSYWKTQHFKALQKQWYERLRSEGFRDAEIERAGIMQLKYPSNHPYRFVDELGRDTKEAYWNAISFFAQRAKVRDEIDRLILLMYAEGNNIKSICEELIRRNMRRTRDTVRYIIRRYETEWGLKQYTRKQLNLRELKTG